MLNDLFGELISLPESIRDGLVNGLGLDDIATGISFDFVDLAEITFDNIALSLSLTGDPLTLLAMDAVTEGRSTDAVSDMFAPVEDVYKAYVAEPAIELLEEVQQSVETLVEDVQEAGQDALEELGENVQRSIASASDQVIDTAGDVLDRAVGGLSDLATDLLPSGDVLIAAGLGALGLYLYFTRSSSSSPDKEENLALRKGGDDVWVY